MTSAVDVAMSGAVVLGKDIACDGFLSSVKARVQTHVHVDHLGGFESSKGLQSILMSDATRDLLCCYLNADLPYRSNIVSVPDLTPASIGDCRVSILSSGHMLGAVQVLVETASGERLGYSGDFQWPLESVFEVDQLVVDSTYGSPASVREYDQGECEARFLQLVAQQVPRGPVHIFAHRGTLQRALQLMTGEISAPILATSRLIREVEVYRRYGYVIGPIVSTNTVEAREIIRAKRFIRLYGTGDQRPAQIESGATLSLTAYFSRPDDPIASYSDRAFGVALSNHADFNGTLEYVQATRARRVITDNTRGKGWDLALEIQRRLGIVSYPSTNFDGKEWGT